MASGQPNLRKFENRVKYHRSERPSALSCHSERNKTHWVSQNGPEASIRFLTSPRTDLAVSASRFLFLMSR